MRVSPKDHSDLAAVSIPSSSVTNIPPSPAQRHLFWLKLKAAQSPSVPTLLPSKVAPCAWQASSMTFRPCLPATASTAPMSAARPWRWTTMIALVFSVMACSIRAGSMFMVSQSMSTKTGMQL